MFRITNHTVFRHILATALVALSLPAAAQYNGFHAAITKQINPVNVNDNSIVELGTLIPRPYELKFNSLTTPAGVTFKGEQSPSQGCMTGETKKCRQYFTMAIDARTSGKCTLNGDYVAKFDVVCTDPGDKSCKPGKHEVGFSLQSENFCSETLGDTSRLWQQIKGAFANDVGIGGASLMWFLDANKSVPGGFDIVSMDLNKTTGMRRSGGAVRIDADSQGNAFVANDKGEMFHFSNGNWNKLPGLAKDIGVGANGTAWCIGANQVPGGFGVYRWNLSTNNWEDMKGGGMRIDVDPQGNAWIVNSTGQVWRHTGSGWVGIPGV